MPEILKGSVLQEVAPYAVVPLYDEPSQDGDVVSKRGIGTDPTIVPDLEDLPRWEACRIWNQEHVTRMDETPELKKFLRRARRMASTSADNVATSWQILCILSILRLVAENACNEKDKQETDEDKSKWWWSRLVSENYDDETERNITHDGCDDNDDGSLLVELWPHIREHIPWLACQRLYHRIQNRMHILTVPHPLKAWAQKTIFELTNDEFETSWKLFHAEGERGTLGSSSAPPNRLRASKLWLDRVANIPERHVGVLIESPLLFTRGKNDMETSTALTLPRPFQSHLPNTCLELHVSNNAKIQCKWIALYDLSSEESDNKNRTLSTMPRPRQCDFFDANGNIKTPSPTINATNLSQARRLAHSHFFKEDFGEALSLYQECHEFCASTKDTALAEADLWHAMGAVFLSQRKFASAQEHWKNGSLYQNIHKEISEQLEKQRAYHYFDPLPKSSPSITFKQQILRNPSSVKSQSIYVASDVIGNATCRKLIDWAKDYALSNGGWTASRHYAVPTNDLPIHKVPKLLEWFQDWMPNVLFPLLKSQFGGSQRFYVHDAFLVRYEATASSCFLPLHYDESTHSCVLALNDDFDGGGSYVYDLDRSIAPETGGMVSFLGNQCLHGGTPVTRGTRYILAIFLFQDRDLADSSEEIASDGIKRRDESENSVIAKRSKVDDGMQADQGGGFSFSFF